MEPDDIYREVGRNIRRCREAARRKQEQLAAEIGISRASLANIEVGRQKIRLHHLYAIAAALDLHSPAMLLPKPALTPHDDALSELPLPKEGLTDKQRLEVLHLLNDVLTGRKPGDTGGEG